MTNSSETSMKLPEKSNFSQTCSLLSQYLKERGSFGDLSLGMTCNIEAAANGKTEIPRTTTTTTTMNLFPMIEKHGGDVLGRNIAATRTMESMNLFPQQTGFASVRDIPVMVDSSLNKTAAVVEPKTAQMTIFYGGQVIVFNDFPADKAKEVMLLAGNGSSQTQFSSFPPVPAKATHNAFPCNLPKSRSTSPIRASSLVKNTNESTCSVPSNSNIIPNFSNNLIPENVQPSPRSIPCDLPIARRNSLHRFLEKRKDRITARAPYQMSGATGTPPPNKGSAGSKSWLNLTAQSPQ